MCVCVCVCVCERENESVCVCVCICVFSLNKNMLRKSKRVQSEDHSDMVIVNRIVQYHIGYQHSAGYIIMCSSWANQGHVCSNNAMVPTFRE